MKKNGSIRSEVLFSIKVIEAILFSSPHPVSAKVIKSKLPEDINFEQLIDIIKNKYLNSGFNLYKVSDAWAFRTSPEVVNFLTVEKIVKKKLSKAALEILAIIAYYQPITRAEIEDIRGVSVGQNSIENLFESSWVEPKGHKRVPGKPSTWRTTKHFLDHFGLESIKDLPNFYELKSSGLLSRNIEPSLIKKPSLSD